MSHIQPNTHLKPTKVKYIFAGDAVQGGTDPPTVTVNNTTMPGEIIWTRLTTGQYQGTLEGAFPENRTAIIVGMTGGAVNAYREDDDNVRIITFNAFGSTADSLLTHTPIIITVYKP